MILIDKIANNTNEITSSSIAADKIRQPIVVFYYEYCSRSAEAVPMLVDAIQAAAEKQFTSKLPP